MIAFGGWPRAAEVLRGARLERAIGVIYRPQAERQSRYFRSRLADQFDAVIHIDETRALEPLERTARWERGEAPLTIPTPCEATMTTMQNDLTISAAGVGLQADVQVPPSAHGVVLFAHGSGSGRHSPRNRYVAQQLNRAGLATVLADLLTEPEERVDALTRQHRFDIGLLATRLAALADWATRYEPTAGLRIGLFGASTGAAAALVAAAVRPSVVHAVVSRGGRPDLAGDYLARVHQPTLLIVGGADRTVLRLNQEAIRAMTAAAETRLAVVPGASHLFAEPGALEQVARLATDWFVRFLPDSSKEQ